MTGAQYTRYELLRAFRNRRFFGFSLIFPLILYFVLASPQRNDHDLAGSGISAPLYYMAGLIAFGTMIAMISSGGRIAIERQIGWTRQLRITPLSTRSYFRAKVLTGYTMASLTILLLAISGTSFGVSLSAQRWLEMIGLILVGLMPFAAMGILLGHLLNPDSLGPATGGLVSVLAILSGNWYPLAHGSFLYQLAQYLPSYWLVQAAHVAVTGQGWGSMGWTVVLAWTAVLALGARAAFRRDTQRVS